VGVLLWDRESRTNYVTPSLQSLHAISNHYFHIMLQTNSTQTIATLSISKERLDFRETVLGRIGYDGYGV
jgi:hypothetical protein